MNFQASAREGLGALLLVSLTSCRGPTARPHEVEVLQTDPFVSEFLPSPPGARISLDVRRQEIEVFSREPHAPCRVANLLPGREALWLSGVGEGRFVIAGRETTTGDGFVALARLLPGPPEVLWARPVVGARAITCVDVFPDRRRVALLDGIRHDVWSLGLDRGVATRIATARDHPALVQARYLSVWVTGPALDSGPEAGPRAGVLIRVSREPESAAGLGRLSGALLDLVDADGDGIFESIR